MEDYIYILIGVIWLAASVYRASQKNKKKAHQPKQASKPAPAGEQRENPVRSLLEELLEGQQVRIPEPVVTEVEAEKPSPRENTRHKFSGSFQEEYSKAGFSALEMVSGEGMRSLSNIYEGKPKAKHRKKHSRPGRVDLRKAIIYKAILERPYT